MIRRSRSTRVARKPKRPRPAFYLVDVSRVVNGGILTIHLPLRVESESNERGHWTKKAKRTASARGTVAAFVRASLGKWDGARTSVELTRLAPCELDDDNLRGSLKATRDGVADAMGIDDRDPRVTWNYHQESKAPRTYGVRIVVRSQP